MNPAIVTAAHKRPSEKWIEAIPDDIQVIIVVDQEEGFEIPRKNFKLFNYKEQKRWLADFYPGFECFQHSPSCRNFGFWWAWLQGFDPIISLDYDCIIPENFVKRHLSELGKSPKTGLSSSTGWINPLKDLKGKWFQRGYPYSKRENVEYKVEKIGGEIKLNMGLWENEIDVCAKDKIGRKVPKKLTFEGRNKIAIDNIPLSAMNFAIRRELIPALFFPPNYDFDGLKFRRHEDVWGGYILKQLMDIKGDLWSFGYPMVYHDAKADLKEDMKNERDFIDYSEGFYDLVDVICESMGPWDYDEMFGDFVESFSKRAKGTIFEPLIKPYQWWMNLFEKH